MLVALAMMRQGQPIYDDPYILFRYAKNLSDGHGWSFNPTVKTENAVTSVSVVLILALFGLLGFHIPAASTVLFFLSTWTCATFIGLTLKHLGSAPAGIVAGTLVAVSSTLTSFWGMETSLFLALLTLLCYLAVTKRSVRLIGILLGLLVLTRPDGLVFGGVALIAIFGIDRSCRLRIRQWVNLGIAALIPILLWSLIAWWKIGTVVPSTLSAKIAQRQSGAWDGFFTAQGWTGVALPPPGFGRLLVIAILTAAFCGLFIAIIGRANRTIATMSMGFIVGSWIIYGLLLNTASYPWYYAMPIFGIILLASLSIDWVWKSTSAFPIPRLILFGLISFTVVIGSFTQIATGPDKNRTEYAQVGNWLRVNTEPNSTVASTEIGAIGWYSNRTIIDYLGLLDPVAISHVRSGDFVWWAHNYQPDFWVTNRVGLDRSFAMSPCFLNNFEAVFQSGPMVVFRRTRNIPEFDLCG
jgi:hypothetical protein